MWHDLIYLAATFAAGHVVKRCQQNTDAMFLSQSLETFSLAQKTQRPSSEARNNKGDGDHAQMARTDMAPAPSSRHT